MGRFNGLCSKRMSMDVLINKQSKVDLKNFEASLREQDLDSDIHRAISAIRMALQDQCGKYDSLQVVMTKGDFYNDREKAGVQRYKNLLLASNDWKFKNKSFSKEELTDPNKGRERVTNEYVYDEYLSSLRFNREVIPDSGQRDTSRDLPNNTPKPADYKTCVNQYKDYIVRCRVISRPECYSSCSAQAICYTQVQGRWYCEKTLELEATYEGTFYCYAANGGGIFENNVDSLLNRLCAN